MGIRTLLVANRAEIAGRVISTAHRMGLVTVAVFSDVDAGLPYVTAADRAVHLPGAAAGDTYLSIEAVLQAARLAGADAVHPGYGFLSESAAFARACAEAGLTFIGPSAEVMEALASKTGAKGRMVAAGVPVLPGATVAPGDDAAALAQGVGYPLLVKATFGGGGRGMRTVEGPAGLDAALSSASAEAEAAFGDGTVFLERLVRDPRHVEVQVLGDRFGQVVALGERECSIQRRYQKVIEEAPSPAVDDELGDRLATAAVRAASAVGYTGAGTVEFVLGPDGSFAFLEVNARLQVEHPVTEMVTGLDLVEAQLRLAAGDPLEHVAPPTPRGHAVEARLYAEDPGHGYLPASGSLHRLSFPEGPPWPHLRVDAGYREGSVVSTHYDAMLAKVIAWGPDRRTAIGRLRAALSATRVHGVTTNRELLVGILSHPEFVAGTFDTGFLERHPYAELARGDLRDRYLHAVAACLARATARAAERAVQVNVSPGWRNVVTTGQRAVLIDGEGAVEVGYRWGPGAQPGSVTVDGAPLHVELWSCTPESVDLSLDGLRQRCDVDWVGETAYVDGPSGSSTFTEAPRFPDPGAPSLAGSLLAPLPGSVTSVAVEVGQAVEAGQLLVVLEAMKMEHRVEAPHAGRVEGVRVKPGQQVEPGEVLVLLDDDVA